MSGPSSRDYAMRTLIGADRFMESRTEDRETFTEYIDRKRREELP